jgi:hypothetical protein
MFPFYLNDIMWGNFLIVVQWVFLEDLTECLHAIYVTTEFDPVTESVLRLHLGSCCLT